MAENERPLSDFISSVEQVDAPVEEVQESGQGEIKPKKSKVFPIIVGILLLLIIGMGGYYVYDNYFNDSPSQEDDLLNTTGQELEEEEVKTRDYALSEYEFSAKVPLFTRTESFEESQSDTGMNQGDVVWEWDIEREKKDNSLLAYPDYLETVSFTFLPDPAPGCGLGCASEHLIYIDIHTNTGSKSLEQVGEIYFENIKDILSSVNKENDDEGVEIEQSTVSMWGQSVIKFSGIDSTPDSLNEGYLVVTPKYVYIVTYFLSQEPANSLEEANNLMGSFMFGN